MTAVAESWAARLVEAGLSPRERTAKAALFTWALEALDRSDDVRGWWVPGRIEFLGKHTDYAGGPSLLCAVERGFAIIAMPRRDSQISVMDATTGERADAELRDDMDVRQEHWSNYPLTVCRRIARNFPGAARGADITFASDLPPAAGLSSSSALIVATFLAVAYVNDLEARPEYRRSIRSNQDLAAYLGAVENGTGFRALVGDRGVGTQGGSEDHTAILCARAGALVQYSFAPIVHERTISLPAGHVFAIASSGVTAEKTGAAQERYNRASQLAAGALRAWRDATGRSAPTLAAALREAGNTNVGFARTFANAEPALEHRASQFQAESVIVRAAGDALLEGDLEKLGGLVDSSQSLAEKLLGNQVPETIALAAGARELGAIAASAFGAGFGGSVYALVHEDEAEAFRLRWADRYGREFPHRSAAARFFLTAAGPAAQKL